MKTIVIGGGPAGMMAAISAASKGDETLLLEKNEKLGKELFITGKGRCNVTNACDVTDFFDSVCSNPKFLYSAIYGFDNQSLMAFFEEAGV
ncbi:MAG: NAD(P)/FAD-dependent oxidoreductase, partial [Lachnospiraceae bacterium]|nr:NAD(P)/FAD-dependent oxidoreductase [Lachnospiraceae bacterium]